jgi:hypothetical protein
LPVNLLLPLFWIERWILGYHALQRVAQELLNIEQLPSRKSLIELGTEEDFMRLLEAPNITALRGGNSSFQKLLTLEMQSISH